jgi:uncharacterized protein (DUF305 family)
MPPEVATEAQEPDDGSDPEATDTDTEASDGDDDVVVLPWWRNPWNIGAIALAIAVLCGALGWVIGNNNALPDPNATDVGFLQDMRWHHEQAVQMGLMYLNDEGADAAVRTIAREIVVTQNIEIGQMIQMLRSFGKPETNETDTAMTWMNEPTPLERMPGMATDSDLQQLLDARGATADKLFITLMIAHHQGGIHMAQYADQHADVGTVRNLAESMVEGQQSEIVEMQQLLNGG